jgi:hypothetical protein
MADAFKPVPLSTVQRTVTATSASVAIPAHALNSSTVRVVYTAGTASARIRSGAVGDSAITLTTMLVPNPGTPFVYAECFAISPSDTHMHAITDSGTCTLEFTFGTGQ